MPELKTYLVFRDFLPFANLDDSTTPVPLNLNEKQLTAVGARLVWKRLRTIMPDRRAFAVATIRLQTFY